MKFKKLYFLLSGAMIAVGIYSLLVWGLKLGVDFTGGTIAEYKFEKEISTEEATKKLEEGSIKVNAVQETGDKTYFFKLAPLTSEEKKKTGELLDKLTDGNIEELRFETVGPSIGPELVKKTFYAVFIAAGAILMWVAYQFKSIKFGFSAILAMFHDTFILVASFALLGKYFGAEMDFLIVTAVLTTLSFSVHDTIVVYDRIREIHKKDGGEVKDIANVAISETMVRSLNNSFTILFMLISLILLGGTTIRWFSIALFIGTVLGTYSSPFVAVPLLVTWDEVAKRFKKR